MRAEDLPSDEPQVIEVDVDPRADLPDWLDTLFDKAGKRIRGKDNEVFLRRMLHTGRPRDVEINHAAGGAVRGVAASDRELNLALDHSRANVTFVDALYRAPSTPGKATGPHRLTISCYLFPLGSLPGELTVGFGDEVVTKVRTELRRPSASTGAVKQWLLEEFTLPPRSERAGQRFLYSAAPGGGVTSEKEDLPGAVSFTLHGRRWVADIGRQDGRTRILRMVASGNRRSERLLHFSEVRLDLVEATKQAEEREWVRAALAGVTEASQSYLDLWHRYHDIEREVLIDEANHLGSASYTECQILPNGTWQFQLEPGPRTADFLEKLMSQNNRPHLEAAEDLPPELHGGTHRPGSVWRGEIRATDARAQRIELRPPRGEESEPSPYGRLFRALTGDRVRMERREKARNRIAEGHAEMPGLGLLIEGVMVPRSEPGRDRRYAKVLTRAVRDCFAGEPTQSQRRALKMALETPDLLLVQGPPGTGKTQFITALLRCLDELGASALALNRTLVTSYQHDAVDNVVAKARNRGLPPARIDSNPDRAMRGVQDWRNELLGRVDEQLEQYPHTEQRVRLDTLRNLAASYDQPTTPPDLLKLFTQVEELAGDLLPAALRGRLAAARSAVADRLRRAQSLDGPQRRVALASVRSLRATPVSFADDGTDRASRTMATLTEIGVLDNADAELLRHAADWPDLSPPPFLTDLSLLRIRLLERLTADWQAASVPQHDPEIQAMLDEIVDAFAAALGAEPAEAGAVLRAYRADLQSDLDDVRETLQRYNAVLAATVQQVDSQGMSRVLDAPMPVFGTVVVDEAARANPLDLMIPMACARNRIILVGDQRQLPHVLEQKLERELRRTGQVTNSEELVKSLFERWFDMFSGQERPAVRTIRLDEQFRMHPVLGSFVSRVFYGSERAVRSHPSTESLGHDLAPYRDRVAGWLDVPHEREAQEERDGHSVFRRAEARRLAQELAVLSELDSARHLTFGVITFYRKQREVLWEELGNAGLAVPKENDEDGVAYEPARHMVLTEELRPRRRLRVGTVDAFQGMEFDVVLLSVTRSSQSGGRGDAGRTALQRYGHLLSDSRMCVAMSRQRRLLIAVGDPAMADRATAPIAPDAKDTDRSLAEGLVAFRELCEGPHGVVVRP